jgi:adenylate kinase family enzyme
MSRWDDQKWQELIGGQKVDWSIVVGSAYQGKTTLANVIAKHLGFKLIDWKAHEEKVRAKLAGPEGEAFEGKVPVDKIEDSILAAISDDRKAGARASYIFDSFLGYDNVKDFQRFVSQRLQCAAPDYVFDIRAGGVGADLQLARFKKRNEGMEELTPEQQAEQATLIANEDAKVEAYLGEHLAVQIENGRTKVIASLKSDASSEETQARSLKKLLKPRVVLVNHEKRLGVDTTCANLAIKYNMVYLSAYQVIRQHIEDKTEFGRRLLATKKPKEIVLHTQTKDEFAELEYSAAHFDLELVVELL